MKSYYYVKYGDFGNVYSLYWAPTDFTPPTDWERITRKKAERLAAAERYARRTDPAFAYFADSYIWPAQLDDYMGEYENFGDIQSQAVCGYHGWYLDDPYIIRHE